mmetsp:Transcript_22768/g.25595  ORF Transcript_22768/g.25595 Transcript_22768/m.25595 type:complete len:353 (+) Transcript_22768:65-1123(+)
MINNTSNNGMNNTNNQSAIQETKDFQQLTLDALRRTRRQATESKEVGTKTIEQLEDYDARLSKTKQQTNQLVETLKKTEKQQNKFALWSGQFTNRRKAKKELQQEATEAEAAPKTFKRRGPRPKKTTTLTDSNTNNNNSNSSGAYDDDDGTNPFSTGVSATTLNNVVDKSLQTSKDVNTVVNRNELFEKAKSAKTTTLNTKKNKKKERKRTKGAASSSSNGNKTSNPAPTDVVALTEQDQNDLNDIDRMDQLVDDEIDALAEQVTDLLALGTAIGKKATTQTEKLNEIYSKGEEANTLQRKSNKRVQLFTMTRRERNKKEKQFKQNMKELLPAGIGGGSTATTKMAVSGIGK